VGIEQKEGEMAVKIGINGFGRIGRLLARELIINAGNGSQLRLRAIVTRSKLKIEFDEDKKVTTIETPGGNKIVLSDEDKFRIIAKAEKERRQRDSLVERNNTQEG